MTATEAVATARRARSPWFAASVLLLAMALSLINSTIVNVALPTIRTELDAAPSELSWIVSGWALAFGIVLIPAGRLGDRIGHARVFILGTALFTVASVLCGLAQDPTQLLLARILQGAAGGLYLPAVASCLQLLFSGRDRGRAFALMGTVIGVSAAVGPLLGGVLIDGVGPELGWRLVFLVNAPLGLIAAGGALVLLPRTLGGSSRAGGTDPFGLLLLAAGLAAVLVPLIDGPQQGWPLWSLLCLGGGLLTLGVFVSWEGGVERRGRTALVPPRLFADRTFSAAAVITLTQFAAFVSLFYVLAIVLQTGFGLSASLVGLIMLPEAVGVILGSSASGRLADTLGRGVLGIGAALLALGIGLQAAVLALVPDPEAVAWWLLAPLLVAGLGSGLSLSPTLRFALDAVPAGDTGAASGFLSSMQRIGSALGLAVVGTVLFGLIGSGDTAAVYASGAVAALALCAVLAGLAFVAVLLIPRRSRV